MSMINKHFVITSEQITILSSFTDKDLRSELYRRKKTAINSIKKQKNTCYHCKHKKSFTDVAKLFYAGFTVYKVERDSDSIMVLRYEASGWTKFICFHWFEESDFDKWFDFSFRDLKTICIN